MVAMCVCIHAPMHTEATGPSCDIPQEDIVSGDTVPHGDMELTDFDRPASPGEPTLPCLPSTRLTSMHRRALFFIWVL